MTHVKNAEAFARLVDFCTGYGGTYNPGRPTLQIEALSTQKQEANQALTAVINAKALYDNEVNQRSQVFDQLPKLVSSVLRTLEASGASPEKLQDARAFAHQITGLVSKKTASAPVAKSESSAPAAAEAPKAKHSVMQAAYVSKADSFAKLVKAVETEPLYQVNETHLNLSGLSAKLNQLNELNGRVSSARVSWSNARIDRNQQLYHQSQSMVNTGRAVKKYVRAIFGHDSEQYAQVKSLSLTKPH